MKALCGKEYISKAWYFKHLRSCEECQRIENTSYWFRLIGLIIAFIILSITIWSVR